MRKLLCIAVVSGYRTKITAVTNYRALPWWLATVQSIPWLPITVHRLLCNTVVAAYRGKRYRDENSLPRKALVILIMTSLMHTVDGCLYVECVCMCVHVFKVVVSTVMYVIQFPPPLSLSLARRNANHLVPSLQNPYKNRVSLVESDRTYLPGRSVIGWSLQNYPYVWALCR